VVSNAAGQIEDAGIMVEEASPDFSDLHDIFDILRAYSYAAGLGDLLEEHAALLNQDVVWNIRRGSRLSVNDIVRAASMRTELVRRVARFFQDYDLIITPSTIVPPYPVEQRYVERCDGHQFDNYYRWLAIAYAFTTALCPALSMPCGLTAGGLPVGLQVAAPCGNDAQVLSAANIFEEIFGLKEITPISPRHQSEVQVG